MKLVEGKGHIFESCFYNKLRNASIFAIIHRTLYSLATCCENFAKSFFLAGFCRKKNCFFLILSKQFQQSPLPVAVPLVDVDFLQRFIQDHCQLLSCICIGSVVTDRGWIFRQAKFFHRRVFGKNNQKANIF